MYENYSSCEKLVLLKVYIIQIIRLPQKVNQFFYHMLERKYRKLKILFLNSLFIINTM